MTDTFQIQLPDGRTVGIQAGSPEEAAQGAKNILAREQGEKQGKGGGALQYVDNLVRQVANGITFGYADEIASALDAALGRKGSYSENLAENRAQDKAFSEANPIAAGAANIAGNIGSTALALPAKATAMGASLVGNMAKFGTVGAGLGAVQGFGEGEGGFTERAAHALPAAAFGAAGGALVPAAGAAAQRISETPVGQWVGRNMVAPAASKLADLLGKSMPAKSLSAAAPDGAAGAPSFFGGIAEQANNPAERGALDRLATALQRSGGTETSANAQLDRLGPAAMGVDLNEQFLREAERAYTMPGKTASYADPILDARAKGAPSRMRAAFEGDTPPKSRFELMGDRGEYDQIARKVGADSYQGDMVEGGLKQSPELRRLLDDPNIDGAIKTIKKSISDARAMNPNIPEPSPVELMHLVKREIQGLGYDKATGHPLSTSHYWREASDHYVDTLKAANPALAEADRAYAQAKSLPDYFQAGSDFLANGQTDRAMNASSPALAEMLAKATPQQIGATDAGMVNTVRERVGGLNAINNARSLARGVIEGEEVQKRIQQVAPDRFGEIMRASEAEKVFSKAENIRNNSRSALRLGEMLDTGNAGFRVSPDKISPRFYERLADLPNILLKPNEAVRDAIGRMTLNPNQEETRRVLALAAELMKKRQGPHTGRLAIGVGSGESMVRD